MMIRRALLVVGIATMASAAHAQKWVAPATISPTTPLIGNSLCFSDGRDLACDSSAGLLITSGTVAFSNVSTTNISVSTINGAPVGSLGGGSGDRIVSGSLLAVANSATGYISLTTGATNWGYLSSGVSYIPNLASNFVSATNISASTAYVKNTMMVSGSTYVSDLTIMGVASGASLDPTLSVSASGADTQVQYNSSGSLAGSSSFTYSSGVVSVTGTVTATNVYAQNISGTTGTFGSITVGSCSGCGGGGGSGDRITSSTTGLTANGSAKTISVTTNNVVTGYFNSNGMLTVPGISATSNLTSVTTLAASKLVQLNGGLLFNQGPLATDNLMYVGSASPGSVNASFGFFVGGVGSGNSVDGPYFLARGNDFTDMGGQRGMILFSAGRPSSPSGIEGAINFWTQETARMIINYDGNVGIGLTNPNAALDVLGTVSASNVYVTSGAGAVSATRGYFNNISATSITVGSCTGCGGGGGTGDRIVSGTNSIVAQTASNIISITTNNVVTGYFNANGVLTAPGISATSNLTSVTTLYASGKVGIGLTNPGTPLEVNGIVSSTGVNVTGDISYTGVLTDTSDRRLKHDIKPLPFNSAMERIMLMKPVQFRMNDRPDRVEWGFVAQDVEKLFPNLVFTANDAMGTKTLNYIGLISPMVQGMQELKADNDNLRAEMEQLKAQVRMLTRAATVKTTGSQGDAACTSADVGVMRRNPKTNRPEICH